LLPLKIVVLILLNYCHSVISTRRARSARPVPLTLSSHSTQTCHPDPLYPVIPTAVEGSQPVGNQPFNLAQAGK